MWIPKVKSVLLTLEDEQGAVVPPLATAQAAEYRAAGRVAALALTNGYTLGAPFARYFLRAVLSQVISTMAVLRRSIATCYARCAPQTDPFARYFLRAVLSQPPRTLAELQAHKDSPTRACVCVHS